MPHSESTMSDWNIKVTSPWNRVFRRDNYLEGCVFTPHGIVYAYSQGGMFNGVKDTPHTSLQFVYDGRVYIRSIKKRYTQRGIVTVANRFAGEVIYG